MIGFTEWQPAPCSVYRPGKCRFQERRLPSAVRNIKAVVLRMVGDDVMQTDSKRNSTLRELLKAYATRAREFSDDVARLGAYEQGRIGPEFLGLLAEIKRRQVLCISSGEDLYRYVAA